MDNFLSISHDLEYEQKRFNLIKNWEDERRSSAMEHLCQSVEQCLNGFNWYGALILSLTLPDIAANIDNPTLASGLRYSQWIQTHLSPAYTTCVGAEQTQHCFLNGGDCYALRCAFLHEGSDDVSHHRAAQVLEKFTFVAPRSGLIVHRNQAGTTLQLQVDIFCKDIVTAVRDWQSNISSTDTDRFVRLNALAEIQTQGSIMI